MENPLAEGILPFSGQENCQPNGSSSYERKIRVAYVTSPRELYGEGIGSDQRIIPTLGHIYAKMQSNPSLKNAELAAVFVDDNGCEVDGKKLDVPHRAFAYLADFCKTNKILFRVEESKHWRIMPKTVLDSKGERIQNPQKHERKMEYEQRMLDFMRKNEIDVLISDSYVVLFNSVMLDPKIGFPGLIINIHPGIASEVPGVTPNFDSVARAHFFTDDAGEREAIRKSVCRGDPFIKIRKTEKFIGSIKRIMGKIGAPYIVADSSEGYECVYIRNTPGMFRAATGSTLHVVDEKIDHGPTIICSAGTPIRHRKGPVSESTVHELRVSNYETKNRIAERGLAIFLGREETRSLIMANRVKNSEHNRELTSPSMVANRQDARRIGAIAAAVIR